MKPLIVSWSDVKGGAAKAALRLHQGLRAIGMNSTLLVAERAGDDAHTTRSESKFDQLLTRVAPHIDALALRAYPKRSHSPFTASFCFSRIPGLVSAMRPDIVHMHWVHNGFMDTAAISCIRAPAIWTLHDMWAMTGGCHYSADCRRFLESCGNCPQLGSGKSNDLSRRVFNRKRRKWRDLDLTVVTPSRWLAKLASSSSLLGRLRIETIPNGLDLQRYRPYDKRTARDLLKLPQDTKLLLFGAMTGDGDKRKGCHLLLEALHRLAKGGNRQFDLVVFGARHAINGGVTGFKIHSLGFLGDELTIALAYSAADVFVVPSVEDNLPNTIAESMACGTPCVAFSVGGIPEMIDHEINGYLAPAGDVGALASGFAWMFADDERRLSLGSAARTKAVRSYDQQNIARLHRDLYQDVIENRSRGGNSA